MEIIEFLANIRWVGETVVASDGMMYLYMGVLGLVMFGMVLLYHIVAVVIMVVDFTNYSDDLYKRSYEWVDRKLGSTMGNIHLIMTEPNIILHVFKFTFMYMVVAALNFMIIIMGTPLRIVLVIVSFATILAFKRRRQMKKIKDIEMKLRGTGGEL